MSTSPSDEAGEAAAQKVSVSMDARRVAAVRARVGARGFSAYVSAAVERQLQRDLLEELLAENEAETGLVPQEMKDRAERAFQVAEALADRERDASSEAPMDESTGEGVWRGRKAS